MSNPENGGPAYPTQINGGDMFGGMTLRDWFAGQALTGLLSGNPDSDCGPHGYAKDAYLFADSLIAEREKPND